MDLSFLVPYPQQVRETGKAFARPPTVRIVTRGADALTVRRLAQDLKQLAGIKVSKRAAYTIQLKMGEKRLKAEGYRLKVGPDGVEISGADAAGLYYGTQTLVQIATLGPAGFWPALAITDWPHFAWRSYMPDMGRSVYPLPLLKRMVRILARLKLNAMHLHICDDQLNSLRYRKLPLGKENPTAITLSQLAELVRYARSYHVTIMPEIECWGHANSFVYHYPHLDGGPGMYGGASFAIGPELYDLLGRVFDELVGALEKKCHVHVGLDEAIWQLLPSVPEAERASYNPERLIQELYDILQRAGRRHGRQVTMHLWADHKGRSVPKQLENKLILHPWRYLARNNEDIEQKLVRLGGKSKPRIVMGTGTGLGQAAAHFLSTGIWCRAAANVPNVLGGTICQWSGNNVPETLIGIYAGADYLWSPATPATKENDPHGEETTWQMCNRMRQWQSKIKDGDPEAILHERGPEVWHGFYRFGRRDGKPVSPTATANERRNTGPGVDG
jgi:hypothetical protein